MAWLAGYKCRRLMTIDHDKITGDLGAGFPVLVSFSGYTNITDGNDVKFTDNDGTTKLSYEKEYYSSGAGQFWVKINDSVLAASDTEFYMYYCKAGDSDESTTSTWDSNYNAVYHMVNDNGNTDDSTSNSVDGTKQSAGHPAEVTGQIYKGQHFDAAQDYIALANDSFASDNTGTIECWIKRDLDARNDTIFSSSDEDAQDLLWLRVWGSTDRYLMIQFHHRDGADVTDIVYGDTTLGTGWRHVAVTSDGSDWVLYVDGASDGANILDGSNSGLWFNDLDGNVHAVKWGVRTYDPGTPESDFFDGIIDEARISSTARSAAWIKASYHSGKNDLLTYGSEVVFWKIQGVTNPAKILGVAIANIAKVNGISAG